MSETIQNHESNEAAEELVTASTEKAVSILSNEKAEIKEEKRQNRKIDISLILSIAALLVALLQFIISSPFFIDYYYKANFEIVEEPPMVRGKTYTTIYIIQNPSKNTVNNIEVSIQMMAKDIIQSIPGRLIQFNFEENGPNLKNCFFSIDKLVPNESFAITIDSDIDSTIYYNSDFFKNARIVGNELEDSSLIKMKDWKLEHMMFPNIIQAKFDKGFATIKRQPIQETLVKLEKLKRDTIRK